jgi:hypothetical protein
MKAPIVEGLIAIRRYHDAARLRLLRGETLWIEIIVCRSVNDPVRPLQNASRLGACDPRRWRSISKPEPFPQGVV